MGSRSHAHRRRVSISLVALATALFFIPGVPNASGEEAVQVNCPGDSLQAAIDAASPGDYIIVSGWRCLENVVIDKDLQIEGNEGYLVGGGSGPVVHVLPGVTASITSISINRGVAEYGAGIYNEGTLSLDRVSMSDNRATISGGAIRNDWNLRIWDSYIHHNVADGGPGRAGGGGALWNLGTTWIGSTRLVENSTPEGFGGAVLNHGEMTIAPDVSLESNRGMQAGALANRGTLTATNMYVTGTYSLVGSGVLIESGVAEITDSVLERNVVHRAAIGVGADGDLIASGLLVVRNSGVVGGGISIDGGSASLTASEISRNGADIGGGGIALHNGASLTANGLVVDGNRASNNGGGILAKNSTVELADSQITNNTANNGGGISNAEGSNTTLLRTAVAMNMAHQSGGGVFNTASDIWITQSTVSNNTAAIRGGGVANLRGLDNARVFITNSTVARNDAPQGSAIDNSDVFVALDHVTITENEGSAAFYEDKSPAWTAPVNSIIAGNPDGDCWGVLDSGGGNVFGDCFAAGEGSPRPTDISGVADPRLTPVFDVAGYVHHYEPVPVSPAVNRVPALNCTLTVDQVGTKRPVGSGCDSGSIELAETIAEMLIDGDFAFGDVFTEPDVTFTGWALDDLAVRKVLVGIKDRDRGLWLQDDKTTWGSFNQMLAELSPPGAASTVWALDVHLDDGHYSLAARAFDYDGNWVDIVPYRHFAVAADVTAPQVDADFAPRTEFFSPVLLTGTATDDTGVEAVRVAIRDRVSKNWLQADRVSWGPYFSWFHASGDGWTTTEVTWYFEVELPIGQYNLAALAVDAAGNWGEMSPYRAFDVIAE